MKRLKCKQCAHKWFARRLGRPKVCPNPKCHSAKWDGKKRIAAK